MKHFKWEASLEDLQVSLDIRDYVPAEERTDPNNGYWTHSDLKLSFNTPACKFEYNLENAEILQSVEIDDLIELLFSLLRPKYGPSWELKPEIEFDPSLKEYDMDFTEPDLSFEFYETEPTVGFKVPEADMIIQLFDQNGTLTSHEFSTVLSEDGLWSLYKALINPIV